MDALERVELQAATLRSLKVAMNSRIDTGEISDLDQAVSFVATWTEATENWAKTFVVSDDS